MLKLLLIIFCAINGCLISAHEAKDFDDSVLYKIDFEMPDFNENPELQQYVRTFYTVDKERYDCVIPPVADSKEEKETNEPTLSPYALLEPIINTPSCSYRIEAYWSYEVCHGRHVKQYHEEREGKTVKSQEYYLGKWTEEKKAELLKNWEEDRKTGRKYKTLKIDNIKYPYFELEMTDGTMCDIINAPRTTLVRYVCYPHGKNDVFSFKETSSCNYEAIILTSTLCMIPEFLPEESKEVSIKCFNAPADNTHKPLSLLRQELSELQIPEDDFPPLSKADTAGNSLAARGTERYLFDDVNRLVLEFMTNMGVDVDTSEGGEAGGESIAVEKLPKEMPPVTDLTPVKEFISGRSCLKGGTGWWRFEFCYGRHVRQFHKDKKSETELFLGFFNEDSHRQWLALNPEKAKRHGYYSASLWHHYEKGTRCDRTGLPREVDVKLTCTPILSSATAVSMYLLEPKTCQYILVVESPIICDLMQVADEHGLVSEESIKRILKKDSLAAEADLREPRHKDSPVTRSASSRDSSAATSNRAGESPAGQSDDNLRI